MRHVAGRGVEQGCGNNVLAEEHHEPMHRPHEFSAARAPAHALGDRQAIKCGLDNPRQQRRGVQARFRGNEEEKRTLGFLERLQHLDARAAALRERKRSTGRLSGGVERGANWRPAALHVLLRLPGGQTLHQDRKAPRRCKRQDLAMLESRREKTRAHTGCKSLGERKKCFRRQLFGAELNEKIVLLDPHAPLAAAVCFSIGKPSASRLE